MKSARRMPLGQNGAPRDVCLGTKPQFPPHSTGADVRRGRYAIGW